MYLIVNPLKSDRVHSNPTLSEGATHVINENVPDSMADYLHRAGRAGRIASNMSRKKGGRIGTVVTLPK